jgi:hypothetical protein
MLPSADVLIAVVAALSQDVRIVVFAAWCACLRHPLERPTYFSQLENLNLLGCSVHTPSTSASELFQAVLKPPVCVLCVVPWQLCQGQAKKR